MQELKPLIKNIPCEYKCKFDSRKYDSDQKWNNDKCRCECTDSVIMCDEIMEEIKTIPTKFNELNHYI